MFSVVPEVKLKGGKTSVICDRNAQPKATMTTNQKLNENNRIGLTAPYCFTSILSDTGCSHV